MTLLAVIGARVRLGEQTFDLPDVRVDPGARLAILGPNGSGKSTLLRVLASLVAAESPSSVVHRVSPDEVVLLPQRPFLVRGTVLWNVKLPLWVRGIPNREAERRAREELARFGAEALAERQRDELSGGEAQRVALARAFVARPRVLLLDEPLGPLDPAGAALLAAALAASADTAIVAAAPTAAGLPPGFSRDELLLSPAGAAAPPRA